MRSRLLAGTVVMCLFALGQNTLTVDQLVSFLRSSLQLKHSDKEIARYLGKVKLSESLSDRTIEELQGEGLGPKAVEVLHALRDASSNLPKPAARLTPAKPAPIPPPDSEEQARILAEVRENALNYTKNLPDFICTQVTRRYVDPTGLEFWQMQDVFTARLSYFEQNEEYKVVLVNNRMVNNVSIHSLGGATSTGEFGSLLRAILEPKSHAEFGWERWATLRGRRMYVFSYRVPLAYSQYRIDFERRMDIVVGHHGLIYVDKDAKMVARIKMEADGIPPSFPVQQASTQLDYDYSSIGDREYLLPLRAEVRMRHNKYLTRNDVEFRLYRKFSAEAVVTFDTPPPLPESKTKEEPPK